VIIEQEVSKEHYYYLSIFFIECISYNIMYIMYKCIIDSEKPGGHALAHLTKGT